MKARTRSARFGALLAAALATGAPAAADFTLKGSQPLGGGPAGVVIQHLFVPPEGAVPYGQPCVQCHDAGAAEPYQPWHGSMMSQSARDPLFYAQLDLANADGMIRPSIDGMADMCLRCHSPVGWLEGRSADLSGMGFIEKDLFGVQCHFCHRLTDPTQGPGDLDWDLYLSAVDAAGRRPTTFGNGMYVVDPKQTRRGPYDLSQLTYLEHQNQFVADMADWNAVGMGADEHPTYDSDFHRSSNLCGTCHDVSNPKHCLGADETDVQDCFPIERTWTEWRHSKFATEGEAGNCQSCHMSGPHNGIGFGAACEQGSALAHLNDVHIHDLTGGNVWVPNAILYLKKCYEDWAGPGIACVGNELAHQQAVNGLYPPAGASPFTGVQEGALAEGSERARRTLRRSATLEVEATTPTLDLKLTNKTGHKLPTGYPEGRRMWMNARFVGAAGNLLAESGEYDEASAMLFHDQDLDPMTADLPNDVAVYTDGGGTGAAAVEPGRPTKVWEARSHWDASDCTAMDPADCPEEFHFVLNNEQLMDNRIPPEDWDPTDYANDRASPLIPAVYTANNWQSDYLEMGSPVHWDRFSYPLPAATDRVRLTLYYQTASREYIDALAADNPNALTAGGFNRGTFLQHVWQATGRSAPVPILSRVQAIVDADGNQLADGWEIEHGLGVAMDCLDDGYNDDPDGDGLSNWQEFQMDGDPSLTADPCDPMLPSGDPPRDPVNVILVLDVSGSMNDPAPVSGTPKIQVLRESVELFLETWRDYAIPEDQIGVVYFGTNAEVFDGSLLHSFVDRWEDVRDDVNMRATGGWTAMGAGLHTAMAPLKHPVTQELIFDPANPRRHHLVLFSNGMQNRSPMLVPDIDFPEFLVVRDQTAAENPDVTGGSNVVIGADLFSGFPIAPHNLYVHTVGIGVVEQSGGDGWHALLEQLALQQSGKHNFITDARQLEGVFLEDLVASLRGNTLEYLFEHELTLGDEVEEIPVPVNPTASKFSLVLSWRGAKSPPPAVELLKPDGVAEPLGLISRRGPDWMIITRFIDPRVGDPGEVGTWTLRLAHPRKGPQRGDDVGQLPPLNLRVHALLDDRELKYQFFVPRAPRVGEPLRVKSLATEGNEPLRWMDEVTVTLRRPGRAIGNLLAASRHRLGDGAAVDADARVLPIQRKVLAAYRDPAFASSLGFTTETLALVDDGTAGDLVAGDGRFERALSTPSVPGHYDLNFRIRGHTLSGHPFTREETIAVMVRIGPISPAATAVVRTLVDGRWIATFAPQDDAGNLLGPGYGGTLIVRDPDGRELGVTDNLDGSYSVDLGVDPERPVRISLGGETFHDGPVPESRPSGPPQWWWWLALVLLVLLVIWLIRRA